ncbi:MAG: IS66-like element accessory protein TnpA, partial [Steroidobacteraceae bacterium]
CKVELKVMLNGTVEIIEGRERRRRWGVEEKLRIVAETQEPGACVREVSARHDVYPSLLHNWRRQVREGRLVTTTPVRFVPIRMAEASPATVEPARSVTVQPGAGTIEVVLPDGSRLRVSNEVGLAALRRVLTALRG